MKIYTGNCEGKKLDKCQEIGLGIMIASSPSWQPRREYSRVFCALDNGAFQCYRRGYPFMADVFLKTIATAYLKGIKLDFIVCPDIVAGGARSLQFSLRWARHELQSAPNLALAVQDGMKICDIEPYINMFRYIFVGGSLGWKWKTAESWVEFAHKNGMKCHIGRCGKIDNLRRAYEIHADSVDSTSFARNESWSIIENFTKQMEMFSASDKETGLM